MEKNLFKNKKRVMDCDDSIGRRAAGELKSNILFIWRRYRRQFAAAEHPSIGIYFCIFVKTCYNQLIDTKIYMIKDDEMPKTAATKPNFPSRNSCCYSSFYTQQTHGISFEN